MKRLSVAAALALALVVAGLPRPAGGQSVYGINFLGEHRYPGSARDRGIGLSGLALRDSTGAVAANEAALADLRGVTFSLVEIFASASIYDGSSRVDQNRFQLPTVILAVPIRPGLVLATGYRTTFEGKGDFSFPRTIEGAPTGLEIYRHRSSLFTVPMSVSWRAARWASVAGSFNLDRGSIRDECAISYRNALYDIVESKWTKSYAGTSFGLSALFEPHARVSLGAAWRSAIEYDVTEAFSYTNPDLDSASAGSFTLPMSWGVGAAVGITQRWWASAAFWTREAPKPNAFPQLENSIGAESLVSFGIERRRSSFGGFFSGAPLRIGFYDDRWHFEYPAGRSVHSRFFTIGSGLRIPGGPGSIDYAFEFGQIGSIGDNGIEERVLRIVFGLNASEAWSKRKQER